MLKSSTNLFKSSRIIVNCLCNSLRGSSTSTDNSKKRKKPKYKVDFRNPNGTFDMNSPTLGLGNRGPTTEDVKEYLRTTDNLFGDMRDTLKEELTMYKEELKEKFREQPLPPANGTIEIVHSFENEDKLDNFVVTTDTDHGIGHSVASLTTTSRETAIFSGFLCNKLKPDGITKYAGYVNFNSKRPMKAFARPTYHDWTHFTHLVVKVRGDGRSYNLLLASPGSYQEMQQHTYLYPLYTRGGPYWQITKIPFSKFVFGAGGYIQKQFIMVRDKIARVGVTLSDNIEGPFSLEIEYIGVERNEYHHELTAYEEYVTDAPYY